MRQTLFAFLFGFLIVTFIIWLKYDVKTETFTNTTDTTTNTTDTTTPFVYRESWLNNVPATRSLKLYLSSSSDIQLNYDKIIYDIPNLKWRNFVATTDTEIDSFNIQKDASVTLTPILNTTTGVSSGFSSKNVILYGPYSYLLAPSAQSSTGGWTMPSFTLMMNVKLNTFTEQVELFNIHADAPYQIHTMIDFSRDTNKVIIPDSLDVTFVFGESEFIRPVPLGNLIYTASTGIFLTFVYNASNQTINIYIGKGDTVGETAKPIPNPTPIPITGSRIEVNPSKKLDALLYNLLYFTAALSSSEIDQIQTALLNELNGSGRTIAVAANVNTEQTTTLQNTITTLQNKLSICGVSTSTNVVTPSYFQIDSLGVSGLNAADLKACSAFNIPKHPLLSSSNDIGRLFFTARPSIIPTWIQYPESITTETQSQAPRDTTSIIPRFLGTTTPSTAPSTTTPTTTTPTTPSTTPTTGTTSTATNRSTTPTILGTNTRRAEFGISTANPIQVANPETVAGLSYEQQRRFIVGQENTSVPLPTVLPSPSSGTSTATNNPTSTSPVFLGNLFDNVKNTFRLFTL
jgi:hypothetical protein